MLCHESLYKDFVERVKFHMKDQYGIDQSKPATLKYNEEVGKIVASMHLDRVERIIKEVEGKPQAEIVIGGSKYIDKDNLWVCPTVVLNPPMDCALMKEEIFAPVLPIIPFVNFNEDVVKNQILSRDKPLAIYYFGNKSSENYQTILQSTSSGAINTNDIMYQVLSIDLGFGGVGGSGMGRYGGFEGFKQWSNQRAVVETVQKNFFPITYLAPPWNNSKQRFIRQLMSFLWLKQNALIYMIIRLLALTVVANLLFGELGNCQARKDIFTAIIQFLSAYVMDEPPK